MNEGAGDPAAHQHAAIRADDVHVNMGARKKASLSFDERTARGKIDYRQLASRAQPQAGPRIGGAGNAARRPTAIAEPRHNCTHDLVARS